MILVDAAVGSKELVEPLMRLGLRARKTHLPYGDVAFVGRGQGGSEVGIGIELKKFRDLVSSLRSGRLQGHQLIGLQQAYDFRWLIVEGQWKHGRYGELIQGKSRVHGSMTAAELEKRLLTLEVQGGIRIRHTFSRADTLRVLGSLYRWWTDRSLEEHDSHITIYHPPTLVPVSQFRQTVSTLPGIGLKLSQVVEQHFGKSLWRAMDAPKSEWAKIEGIGIATADKIVNAIRGVK
jgi:ERCC4-type nuclease